MLLPMCGESVTRIPLEGVGESGEVKMRFDEGTKLGFGVIVNGKYSYTDSRGIQLEIELLRKGKVVEGTTCRGMSFTKNGNGKASGCGCYSRSFAICDVTVPEGGVTAVRVKTHLDGGSAEMSGLEIDVRRK